MRKKWNWMDMTILIVIVLLIVVFFNRDKIIKSGSTTASNVKDVVITLEAEDLTKDMVTDLAVGDRIFSQYSLQNAVIKEITVEPLLKSEEDLMEKLESMRIQRR